MNTVFIQSYQKLILILLMPACLAISGCKKDDPSISESQRMTRLLTSGGGTWTPATTGGVTVDGFDVTEDLFPAFTITFTESTLSTTGSTPVWLREDTWRFKDETATVIIRGQDNKEVQITEISPTQLKLTLTWDETTTSGGRHRSLKGTHEFILNK